MAIRIPGLVLSLSLVGSAVTMAHIEVYARSHTSSLADRTFVLPMTMQGLRRQLSQCDTLLAPQTVGFLSHEARQLAVENCSGLVEAAARFWPQDGALHVTVAVVRLVQGDDSLALAHLDISRDRAPIEGWLAPRRFRIAAAIDPALGSWHSLQSDAAAMLLAQDGAEALAGWYHSRPDLRPVIVSALRRATAPDRKRFLNLARAGAPA